MSHFNAHILDIEEFQSLVDEYLLESGDEKLNDVLDALVEYVNWKLEQENSPGNGQSMDMLYPH